MVGYRKNYLKTYLWSGLSLVLNFVSMFIVAPLTTTMPEAYGVYSLCVGFGIFLRYADLGFIDAGRKYAAEAFAVRNHELEKKYIGTSIFVYGAMTIVLFFMALFFSRYPELLIKDIDKSPFYDLSRQFLLILALTFPLSIIQKFCSLIYVIRIEEYKIQCFQILGSMVKISSVPLYFFNNRYDIVGYYLFCEIINIIVSIIILYRSKGVGYGFKEFVKCLRIDKTVLKEITPLALSGFTAVLSWIAYYELDSIGISVLLGANAVAIYTVAKSLQTFVRSLVGIAFSPYPARINYFIGQKDLDGLKRFYFQLCETFSIIIIPIVTIVLFAKPLVFSWVGVEYEDSCFILQLLVMTFIIHHITSQANTVVYGLNKVKDIIKLAVIQPFFFWIGVLATYKIWGVNCFAIFKLVACLVTGIYYCLLVRKYLGYNIKVLYWDLLSKPLLVIGTSCSLYWFLVNPLLDNVSKSHKDLILVGLVMAIGCFVVLTVDFLINKSLKSELYSLVQTVIKKVRNYGE